VCVYVHWVTKEPAGLKHGSAASCRINLKKAKNSNVRPKVNKLTEILKIVKSLLFHWTFSWILLCQRLIQVTHVFVL